MNVKCKLVKCVCHTRYYVLRVLSMVNVSDSYVHWHAHLVSVYSPTTSSNVNKNNNAESLPAPLSNNPLDGLLPAEGHPVPSGWHLVNVLPLRGSAHCSG